MVAGGKHSFQGLWVGALNRTGVPAGVAAVQGRAGAGQALRAVSMAGLGSAGLISTTLAVFKVSALM